MKILELMGQNSIVGFETLFRSKYWEVAEGQGLPYVRLDTTDSRNAFTPSVEPEYNATAEEFEKKEAVDGEVGV